MDQQNLPEEFQQPAPTSAPTSAPTPIPVLPSSTLAIVSLIAGIAGFTFLPVIGCIVALLTGYAARKETRAVPPTASGDGMATAGIVMGWIQIALGVIGACCFIFFFLFAMGGIIWGNAH